MAARQPLNDDERRLFRITARMPLASVANLAPVLDLDEEKVRRMLGALRRGGWVTSVVRGMTERRQHRWFLTRQAVDLLYVTGHQHPASREEARASGLAAFHPEGELPEDYRDRFALNHDHPVHLEDQGNSPFTAGDPSDETDGGPDHEHPPWTATSRGIESSLRRLAMLEPVYRLAPDLLHSGRVNRPADVTGGPDDRLPAAQALRLLPRRGPLRPRLLDPLHLRRTPRDRSGSPAQGAAPLLGRGLLLPPGGPLPAHRQPGLLRGPGLGGGGR